MLYCLLLLCLIVGAGAQGVCPDVPPDTTFPCDFYPSTGGCEAPYNDLKDATTGLLQYCLVTCGLCDLVDLSALPATITSVNVADKLLAQGGSLALAEGRAISVDSLVTTIVSNVTEAIVSLDTSVAEIADKIAREEAVIAAASTTAQAVSTAIASAMAQVSLRGLTTDENSVARGSAEAQARAIANATASAYSIAIAEVVSPDAAADFTELEASTLISDVQTALTSAAIDISITGNTSVQVSQTSYATAVAESVANATARAFARIVGEETTAIALATAQAFNSSQLTCLSICNNEPPTPTKTCQQYVDAEECAEIIGYCECECGSCSVGSEASIETYVDIISDSDSEQLINAFGEAFAQGAKGSNAVTSALVSAVVQGKSNAVASAVAEAFGGLNNTGTAIVDVIVEAINLGGENVTTAIADGFALAESGGYASSLAQAISSAFTLNQANSSTVQAITTACAVAIADGGCEAIAASLAEAQALAVEEGAEDAFAAAVATSEAVNSCLQGSDEIVSESVSDTYVVSTGSASATSVAQAQAGGALTETVAGAVTNGSQLAVASVTSEAFATGGAEAVVQGFAKAVGEGAGCETISEALVTAAAEAATTGDSNAFSEAVGSVAAVSACLAADIRQCNGISARDCCTALHPAECRCVGTRCLASLNDELSSPLLGLYVYNDVGSRQCKCPM